MSAYGYDSSPDRYSTAEWERSKQETLAARSANPSPQGADAGRSPSTLVPGIVRMSLRGDDKDILAVVAALRGRGFKVWVGDSPGTRSGNGAGFRYFTVQILSGDGDG